MHTKLISAFLLLSSLAFAVERGEEIKLWPKDVPGSEGETAAEVSKPSTTYPKLPAAFTVTHYPSIYVFLPPKEKANGMAMVVAPGGGHSQLVIEKVWGHLPNRELRAICSENAARVYRHPLPDVVLPLD